MRMKDFLESLDRLYRAGDRETAERVLLHALEHAAGREKAALLNELGGFYRGISRYEESAGAFRGALSCLEALGQDQGAEYATVLLNLGGACRLAGKQTEAEQLLKQALCLLTPEESAYVGAQNALALVYREEGLLEEAIQLEQEALAWLERHGASDQERATALNNLASLHLALGQTAQAACLIEQSLSLFGAMTQPDPHYAAALSTRGAICFRLGKTDQAELAYREAMELTEHYFGRNQEYQSARAALETVRQSRRNAR